MKYIYVTARMLVACLAFLMTLVAMVDKEYVPAVIAATAFGVSIPPYRGKANGVRWVVVVSLMLACLILLPEVAK